MTLTMLIFAGSLEVCKTNEVFDTSCIDPVVGTIVGSRLIGSRV